MGGGGRSVSRCCGGAVGQCDSGVVGRHCEDTRHTGVALR